MLKLINPVLRLFGWQLERPKPPANVTGIKRDDGSVLTFDEPVTIWQALSAKSRGL